MPSKPPREKAVVGPHEGRGMRHDPRPVGPITKGTPESGSMETRLAV